MVNMLRKFNYANIIKLCLFLLNIIAVNFLHAQEPSVALSNGSEESTALEISREVTARLGYIENMQGELGVYDAALIEAYSDFAGFYMELEDYSNAVRFYNEALQIARINTGLYSEQQLPIIEALINNNGKLKEWPEVDDLHQLNYHISSRLYDFSDSEYLTAVEHFGGWKLRVVRENLLDLNGRRLLNTAEDLSDFYKMVIESAEQQMDIKPERLLRMVYGKTETDLTLARSIAATPYTSFEGTASRYVNQTRCQNVRNSQGQVVRNCFTVQVENPRYRQSQRDAKQIILKRYNGEITRSIERLHHIMDNNNGLTNGERQQLEIRIVELANESEQLLRAARRTLLF